ncbi:hypothetical protein GUJ93_ZPchr0011g27102 [Zizania palustris]|uniref:DUF629 domain-containing protein n=1 Tax=Zizania palustris TaxID=103762 RepID=A0A8J5WJW6_ZIZPA|nr:hypothetical protein GUJ93_ZPchr0011g27102 [Zizania palustris]
MAPRNKTASPALRREVADVLKLHNDGEYAVALRRAVKLGVRHGGCALVLNLVGALHEVALIACKSVGREDADTSEYRRAALSAYFASACLVPNCIDVAVSHAKMLVESEEYFDAQEEFSRAIRISNPVDPAENCAGFDLYDKSSTKAERIRNSRGRAFDELERFGAMICDDFVPKESVQVLNGIKLGGNAAADARERAKLLATTFPYSGRAQLLRAHVDLERVRGFDPSIDKRRFLRRTLDVVQEGANAFTNSLVIALFRAKLLFILDEYDDAECECRRALAIDTPDDPNRHDLPPGSVSGADYDARVSFVKNLLRCLFGKIIIATAFYSRTLTSEAEDSLMSVRVQPLLEIYNATDKSSARTITDALRFFKGNNSWSFWFCPLSRRCDGRKFADNSSLSRHLYSKHPEELWSKLQSVLDPKPYENTSDLDHSLKWITLSQDSEQCDFFRLIEIKDMFESLISRLTLCGTETESLVEMRTKKCREGAEILDGIKEKLRTLPADMSSSQFYEARSGIQNLWHKFLRNSVWDYREAIFPLVSSFVWGKIKKAMAGDPNVVGHIGASKIDPIFDDVPSVHPDKNASVEHVSNPSDANKMPSSSNETHKADEQAQESEICVEDGNSEGMTNQKLSGPPMNVEAKEIEIAEILANMHLEQEDYPSCKMANHNMFPKLQGGNFFASEVVEMILHGLHMAEASLHFDFNSEIEGQSKSFAELPVLYDEQPCSEGNCEHCGSPKNIDVSPSNTPHVFTIGLDWVGGCENQVQLSEVLVGITQPLEIKFLRKGVHSSSSYSLASRVCALKTFLFYE